jgi:hypothetical protein
MFLCFVCLILKTGVVRLSFWGSEEGGKKGKGIVLQESKTGD